VKAKAFFCEACGKPVALKASKCPHCGRLFDAVKCPNCSFSGRPELFSDGCPSCGYLRHEPKGATGKVPFREVEKDLVTPDSDGVALRVDSGAAAGAKRRKKKRRELPSWAYSLLSVVLIIVLIVIGIVYMRL
jgi:hypothetical protein